MDLGIWNLELGTWNLFIRYNQEIIMELTSSQMKVMPDIHAQFTFSVAFGLKKTVIQL